MGLTRERGGMFMIRYRPKTRLWPWVMPLVLATFFLIAPITWGQPANLDTAKKEGKVVVYGTIGPQVMTIIEKGFEGKYGLKVEYWRADATKVIDRVLTEWRAGKPGFDLVIGARGALLLGKEENIYAKFVPANTANFPAKLKDADGKRTTWRDT